MAFSTVTKPIQKFEKIKIGNVTDFFFTNSQLRFCDYILLFFNLLEKPSINLFIISFYDENT